MNKVLKVVEYVSFIVLNLLLATNILPLVVSSLLLGWLIFDDRADSSIVFSWIIIMIFLSTFLKTKVFSVIYIIKNKYSKDNVFFERFKSDKLFRKRVFLAALITDLLCLAIIYVIIDIGVLLYVVFGGGVLISYLSLQSWFKKRNMLS
ncbi:MAG: hypothetical protein PHX18_07175 [Candidatus Gastranaerophilales bacterium]|nr:hypothetical protein [Candidatus Gastranaerophilales bacterium]